MHRIHLRAPWRIDQPESGTLVASRRFHRPSTGMSEGERVWLVIPEGCGTPDPWLNGRSLGDLATMGATRFDITDLWLASNVLELRFYGYDPATDGTPPANRDGPSGTVTLEFTPGE